MLANVPPARRSAPSDPRTSAPAGESCREPHRRSRRAAGKFVASSLAALAGVVLFVLLALGQDSGPQRSAPRAGNPEFGPASGNPQLPPAATGPGPNIGVVTVAIPRSQFVHRVQMSAERVGVVAETVKEGQRVRKGEIVARLRDEVAVTMLAATQFRARSRAEIEAAQKAAEAERHEHRVMLDANQNRVANRPTYTDADLKRALLRAEQAEAQVQVREHERGVFERQAAQAEAELGTYHLVAPFDGVVTRVLKQPGAGVQQAEALLELVNTDVLRIEGRAPAAQAWRLEVGQPVTVRFEAPGGTAAPPEWQREYPGKLGFVDVATEGIRDAMTIRVWAEIENPGGRLRDGLPAVMQITVDAPGNAAAQAGAGPASVQ